MRYVRPAALCCPAMRRCRLAGAASRCALSRALPALAAGLASQEGRLSDADYEELLKALLQVLVRADILTGEYTDRRRAAGSARSATMRSCGARRCGRPRPTRSARRRWRASTPARAARPTRSSATSTGAGRRPAAVSRAASTPARSRKPTAMEREEALPRRRRCRCSSARRPWSWASTSPTSTSSTCATSRRPRPTTPSAAGRAGRSGQPALVMTYCSVGSGHDQYFFQRPTADGGRRRGRAPDRPGERGSGARPTSTRSGCRATSVDLGRRMLDRD